MNYKYLIISGLLGYAPDIPAKGAAQNSINAANVVKPIASIKPIAPVQTAVSKPIAAPVQTPVNTPVATSADAPGLVRKNASGNLKAEVNNAAQVVAQASVSVPAVAVVNNAAAVPTSTPAVAPTPIKSAPITVTTPAATVSPTPAPATTASNASTSAVSVSPVVSAPDQVISSITKQVVADNATVAAIQVVSLTPAPISTPTVTSTQDTTTTRARANSMPVVSTSSSTSAISTSEVPVAAAPLPSRARSNSAIDADSYDKQTLAELNAVIDNHCATYVTMKFTIITPADRQFLLDYVSKKPYSRATKVRMIADLMLVKHAISRYVYKNKVVNYFLKAAPKITDALRTDDAKSFRRDKITECFAEFIYDFIYSDRDISLANKQNQHIGTILGKTELIRILNDKDFIDNTAGAKQLKNISLMQLMTWNQNSKLEMDNLLKIWFIQAIPELQPEMQKVLDSMNSGMKSTFVLNNIINEVIQSFSWTSEANASRPSNETKMLFDDTNEKYSRLSNKLFLFNDLQDATVAISNQ